GAGDLARRLQGRRRIRRSAALADRARAPRHIRGDARAECAAARACDGLQKPVSSRRLDCYGITSNHRGVGAVGRPRRQSVAGKGKRLKSSKPRRASFVSARTQGKSVNMHSTNPTATVDPVALEKSIASATEALFGYRQADGHFVFELEADSTIPSEYILLRHYLAAPVDTVLEDKIATYLRRTQGAHGGWALVHEGPFDMSASVKSYFALKMIGDSVDAPHMVKAREAIRSRGGAAFSNVFTRFLLALYGVVSWRAVPVLPIEIM